MIEVITHLHPAAQFAAVVGITAVVLAFILFLLAQL